jgi:hypothetical protein
MLFQIFMILIDFVMIYFNYRWAKQEQVKGNKFWQHTFTFFFASWIAFLIFDVVTFIQLIIGG